MERPHEHRNAQLSRTRIARFATFSRILAWWSTWVVKLWERYTGFIHPTSLSEDDGNSSNTNSCRLELTQAPLPAQNDEQTVWLSDERTSLDNEPIDAECADPPARTTDATVDPVLDASTVPPPVSANVWASVVPSEGAGQGDKSVVPSAAEAGPELSERFPSAADREVVPDHLIDSVGTTTTVLPGAANADELGALPVAETPDAEEQGLSADTSAESAEACSTITTENVQAETSSLEKQSPPPAENDATPAADINSDVHCDPFSNLIGPELAAGGSMLPGPDEARTEARPSAPQPIARYQPRLRPRRSPSPRPAAIQTEQEQASGSLEAILLLTFLPGDWGISLAVLLGRADGMPENVEVRVGGTTYSLLAIDARLFEPFEPSGELDLVGDGFAAEATTPPTRRWIRTERDLHVFSERAGVSGFASVPRAVIGQENVVLCRAHLAATAVDCAKAAGSAELRQVAGPGIPEGWVCFRSFRPKAPADFGELSDIFLSLNPLPDAAIELSGGIATGRSTWVVGAPPTIRILGADPSAVEFTIDGHPASPAPAHSDGWLAPGWDAPGTHTIRFGGLSRTYEIVEIGETWPTWATDSASAYFVCGAKVSASAQLGAFAFAGGPRWLLGAGAGDVAFAAQSAAGIAIAAPSFRPVWALAVRTGGRLPPATALPFRAPPQMPSEPVARQQIAQWCNLLRESSAPTEPTCKELWRQYRQLARRLRRRRR